MVDKKSGKQFWTTIKPFFTEKCTNTQSTMSINTEDKILTDAKQINEHMNRFYVNIANKIGGDINISQAHE